jgi:hypothetical protein
LCGEAEPEIFRGRTQRMVDKNDALFREVEEELARERWEKLWKEYGSYVIAAAVLIVGVVGGKQWWDQRQRSLTEAAGAKYEQALTLLASGKSEDGAKAMSELANSATGGYATLADLNLVGQALKAGKTDEALALLDKVAASAPDPLIANYARLQAASLSIGTADFSAVQNRLQKLTVDTSPWRLLARELLATAAWKAGKPEEAKTLLTGLLAEPGLSREAAARITAVLASITGAELARTSAAGPVAPAAAAPAAAPAGASPAN